MPLDLRYNEEEKFIHLIVSGDFGLEQLKEYAAEVAALSEEKNCLNILNDMTGAKIDIDFMDVYHSPRYVTEAGIKNATRRALVVPDDFNQDQFLENVTRNACHNLKVFHNVDDAKEWLLA